jgi:hypothetical protein
MALEVRLSTPTKAAMKSKCAGPFSLETSAFAVDGAEGLSMIVFSPVAAAAARAVEILLVEMSRAA